MRSQSTLPIAIMGAGPYGVSIAAHLRAMGMDFRIFGRPMHRWRFQMPEGMYLKSEGCASSLSDPSAMWTLARFCAEKGLAYADRGIPVPRATFNDYALAFQRELAPMVEEELVAQVEQSGPSFRLRLHNGAALNAAKVIIASGLDHVAHIPSALTCLPPELVTHSSWHCSLRSFGGKNVVVVGAGQSAIELAVLAAEQGASVRLLVRAPSLAWNDTPEPHPPSLYQRLRHPSSPLGSGLELWFCSTVPMLWRHLPLKTRLVRSRTVLGPAGAWWLKSRALEKVEICCGSAIAAAKSKGSTAALEVRAEDGRTQQLIADHVIAATGYRYALERLPFLSPDLKAQIRTAGRQPILSSGFESSVPGLYFTGLASASSFGPAMRFLHGAHFTAARVTRHVASSLRHQQKYPLAVSAELSRAARSGHGR